MYDDLIYKQDAIDILEDERRTIESALNKENFDIMREQLLLKLGQNAEDIILINCLPPAKPAKPGKWINNKGFLSYKCSKCKCKSIHKYKFCPNCGEKMEIK